MRREWREQLGGLLTLLLVATSSAFPPVGVGPGPLRHSDQDRCDPPDNSLPIVAGEFIAEDYARQQVIYVRAAATGANTGWCWQDAYTDLQDALAEARVSTASRVEIWVASGVYRPDSGTGDRSMSFDLVDGVAIFGGFAGTEERVRDRNRDPVTNGTILSGDLLDDDVTVGKTDNAYHVLTGQNLSRATLLDGFQVVGGVADGVDGGAHTDEGGGLWLNNASPRIRWVLFADNLAYSGGAVFVSRGQPLLRYVGYLQNGALNGGAIYLTNNGISQLQFNNLWDNLALADGGGMYIDSGAGAVLSHTRLLNNDAVDGGGVAMTTTTSLMAVSSIFSGNLATNDGGALITKGGGTVDLINTTVASNTANNVGGILTASGTSIEIHNSILWNNSATVQTTLPRTQFNPLGGTLWSMTYTCMQGWTDAFGGYQMTDADPLFVNDNGQLSTDLRLEAGSPLIDAADNNVLHNLDVAGRSSGTSPEMQGLDVNEFTRFRDDPLTEDTGSGQPGDPIIDMGATEFQPTEGDQEPAPIDP